METPERLTMIGGGILLASTLIFTLKSQASSLLPKVEHPIASIYDHAGDAASGSSFPSDFKDAQRNGWQTGHWGTAKFYVDGQHNMYIDSGHLQGSLYDALGADTAHAIRTVNVQGNVQAPADSSYLFSGAKDRYTDANYSLQAINGLDRVDTSSVTDMASMFANDYVLNHLDLSHWNTQNVTSLFTMFNNTDSLNDLYGLNDWNTSKVQNTSWAFYQNPATHLNLSGWHMKLQNASDMFNHSGVQSLDISNIDDSVAGKEGMFAFDHGIQQIKLGNEDQLHQAEIRDGQWSNGQQSLSTNDLESGTPHAGTWTYR